MVGTHLGCNWEVVLPSTTVDCLIRIVVGTVTAAAADRTRCFDVSLCCKDPFSFVSVDYYFFNFWLI